MQNLYQSLVAVEPLTLLVTIGNLFVQMFIIKKFLLDKVKSVLEQRRNAADREISEAQDAKQQALELKSLCEQDMIRVRAEAGTLAQQAKNEAEAQREALLQMTRQQIHQMKRQAQEELEGEKEKLFRETKDAVAGLALEIAEKAVGRCLNEADRQRLTDSVIDTLGGEL